MDITVKNMNIIGVCGYARSGKNLFADIAINLLKEKYNKTAVSLALAYPLKKDLHQFVYEKTELDTFTENDHEKKLIRPMLVAYGNLMRDITNGTYWTNKLEKYINEKASQYDYVFVTDIRYDHYEHDEVYWVKQKMNGLLVHISRYDYQPAPSRRHIHTSKPVKTYIEPANDFERIHDPSLYKKSDVKIEWESCKNTTNPGLELEKYVDDFIIEFLKLKFIETNQ